MNKPVSRKTFRKHPTKSQTMLWKTERMWIGSKIESIAPDDSDIDPNNTDLQTDAESRNTNTNTKSWLKSNGNNNSKLDQSDTHCFDSDCINKPHIDTDPDPVESFSYFCDTITQSLNDDEHWTDYDILKQMVDKQHKLQKTYQLSSYFGGCKPQSLGKVESKPEMFVHSNKSPKPRKKIKSEHNKSFHMTQWLQLGHHISELKNGQTHYKDK